MAEVHPNADDIVAHLPGVRAAVRQAAADIADRARSNLAQHRNTGAAAIEVTHGTTDAHVSLVDDAGLSIEYDHFTPGSDPVRGLRILRNAAEL